MGISETVENLKAEVGGMNNRLTNVTAQAVSNKCGIANINKRLAEIQNVNAKEISTQVSAAISKELEKATIPSGRNDELAEKLERMSKEMDKIRAIGAAQALNPNAGQSRRTQMSSARKMSTGVEEEERQYWAARRRIRCTPIPPGNNMNEFLRNTDNFLEQKLEIPQGELNPNSIVDVQRVPGRKKNQNQHEAVITFDSVQTRDCVASYASNLAGYTGDPALRPGLRLEIPDFLCGVFRVLERYAHILKCQNPTFFKRSIKYDDVNLSLVLDYCTAQGAEWQRATYEEAAEQSRGRTRSTFSSTSSTNGSQADAHNTDEDNQNMNQE